MTKFLKPGLVFLLCLFLITCKKGEDDPFLSLSSRKARLEGTWQLESGSLSIISKSETKEYFNEQYTFTDDTYTIESLSTNNHYEGQHKLNFVFTKNGNFEFTEQYENQSFNFSGTWDFLGGVGKDKKKERVSLLINAGDSRSGLIDMINKGNTFFTYHIRELRNRRLVLETKDELIAGDTVGYFINSKYVFVQ